MARGKGKGHFNPPPEINPTPGSGRRLPTHHPVQQAGHQPDHGGTLRNLQGMGDRAGGEGKAQVRRNEGVFDRYRP